MSILFLSLKPGLIRLHGHLYFFHAPVCGQLLSYLIEVCLCYLNICPNKLLLITLHDLLTVNSPHPPPSFQHACKHGPFQKIQHSFRIWLLIKLSSPPSRSACAYAYFGEKGLSSIGTAFLLHFLSFMQMAKRSKSVTESFSQSSQLPPSYKINHNTQEFNQKVAAFHLLCALHGQFFRTEHSKEAKGL